MYLQSVRSWGRCGGRELGGSGEHSGRGKGGGAAGGGAVVGGAAGGSGVGVAAACAQRITQGGCGGRVILFFWPVMAGIEGDDAQLATAAATHSVWSLSLAWSVGDGDRSADEC